MTLVSRWRRWLEQQPSEAHEHATITTLKSNVNPCESCARNQQAEHEHNRSLDASIRHQIDNVDKHKEGQWQEENKSQESWQVLRTEIAV